MAKKSLARTAFWLFAYREISGTMEAPSSGATTESFIGTNTPSSAAFFSRRAVASDAVVWAPFTICKSFALVSINLPSPRVSVATSAAVAAMPLL